MSKSVVDNAEFALNDLIGLIPQKSRETAKGLEGDIKLALSLLRDTLRFRDQITYLAEQITITEKAAEADSYFNNL